MAFLVQDDSGSIVGATAYIDAAFFTAYHTDRNVTAVVDGNYDTPDVQGAIVLASDYIDSRYAFVGEKQTGDQPMQWPRFDAEDRDEHLIFGIPQVVKEACAELALAELVAAGSLFPGISQDASGQGVKRLKQKLDVLELETEYFGDSATSAQRPPIFYKADWRLKRSGLLIATNRIVRG